MACSLSNLVNNLTEVIHKIDFFAFAKRYLPIWIYEWFRKIQWNIFIWERGFLQSPFEIKDLDEHHDLHVRFPTASVLAR